MKGRFICEGRNRGERKRRLLIEANYVSFGRLLHNRPGVLGVHGAVCAKAGTVTFASRQSRNAQRRGIAAPSIDATGGIEA